MPNYFFCNALAPPLTFADQHSHYSKPMSPVDRFIFDVTDVFLSGAGKNTKEQDIITLLTQPDICA